MENHDWNYQIVYRGQALEHYTLGGWVFFQRPKQNGGGYWLARTYDRFFLLEFSHPVSLYQGVSHLLNMKARAAAASGSGEDSGLPQL